jgi:hypothetical protein
MFRTSILKRAVNTVRVAVVFVGMLSPEQAAYQHDIDSVFPALPSSAREDRSSRVVTAQLPWLAPVGHRQPHQADVPQPASVSVWEREQQEAGKELDRKLIICRGC